MSSRHYSFVPAKLACNALHDCIRASCPFSFLAISFIFIVTNIATSLRKENIVGVLIISRFNYLLPVAQRSLIPHRLEPVD